MPSLHHLLLAVLAASCLLPCPAAAVKRRAFVTSVTGTGDLASWPGAAGTTAHERADAICRAAAAAASPAPLPNASTYRAWISTSTTDAYCHVQGLTGKKSTGCDGAVLPGAGPWYLVNGITAYTASLDQLVDSPHASYRPVSLDEHLGGVVGGRVLTGTFASGVASSSLSCFDWTSGAPNHLYVAGLTHATGASWTNAQDALCNAPGHLLCLEPGASEPTTLGWSPGAIAFVSSLKGNGQLSSWPLAEGQVEAAAGDRICQNLAAAAGLPAPESFIAWLSTSSEHAVDRLTVSGPFRRLDGFAIANSQADLVDGVAANSLHVDEHGAYLQSFGTVWTGTDPDGLAATAHCGGWTDGTAIGAAGRAPRARNGEWTWSFLQACADSAHLYCFANAVTVFWDGFETAGSTSWSATVP